MLRFWRNNSQVIDNDKEQDGMVLANVRSDEEAQRIVDLLNQLDGQCHKSLNI